MYGVLYDKDSDITYLWFTTDVNVMSSSFYASLHYRCAIETILQQLIVQHELTVIVREHAR